MSHVMCSWSEPKEKSNKKTATTFLLAHYVKTIAHILLSLALFASLFSFFLKCGLVHMHFDFECQIRKKMTLEFSKFALFYLYRFLSFLRAKIDWWPAILTSDDFIRSNEIIRTKWPIYEVIAHFVLMI